MWNNRINIGECIYTQCSDIWNNKTKSHLGLTDPESSSKTMQSRNLGIASRIPESTSKPKSFYRSAQLLELDRNLRILDL